MGDALAQYATGQGILTEALFPLAFLRLGDFLNSTERAVVSTLGSQANNPQLNSRQFSASSQMYSANVPVMELLSINVYVRPLPLSPAFLEARNLTSPSSLRSQFGDSSAEPGQAYVSLAGCLQHSLSRGSIVRPLPLARPGRRARAPLTPSLLARSTSPRRTRSRRPSSTPSTSSRPSTRTCSPRRARTCAGRPPRPSSPPSSRARRSPASPCRATTTG